MLIHITREKLSSERKPANWRIKCDKPNRDKKTLL